VRTRASGVWARGEGEGYPLKERLHRDDPGYLKPPFTNGDGSGGGELTYSPYVLALLRLQYEEDPRG